MVSPIQRWAAFSLSVACALLSLTCALGLLASIAMTFATQGRALLAACTFGSPELLALVPNCPFDPTRIYVSVKAWDGMGVIQVLIRGGKGSWSPAFFPQLQTAISAPCSPTELQPVPLGHLTCVLRGRECVRCAMCPAHPSAAGTEALVGEKQPPHGKACSPLHSPDSPYFLGALAGQTPSL